MINHSEAPTLCTVGNVGSACMSINQNRDCRAAALNMRWVCALNSEADVLVRPLCIGEALPTQ